MTLNVNGTDHEITADPQTPLLYVLRNDLRLNAAKFGCGLGQCGACTVVVDGKPVMSCSVPILALKGRRVTSIQRRALLDRGACDSTTGTRERVKAAIRAGV